MRNLYQSVFALLLSVSCYGQASYDIVIRNGLIYDGKGGKPVRSDLAIDADTIVKIGDLRGAHGKKEIDARGMAVAPGFINMLSWANRSLIADGRAQGTIRQGVTLEVMGEGTSMGPLSPAMKARAQAAQGDVKFPIVWTTLGEYLNFLQQKGVSCNVASYVGAATVREYVIGEDDRPATAAELDSMQNLVRQAMREGALGVGSSLIYPPGNFAGTEELIALCKAAAEYRGRYISHLRSEGNRLFEAVGELLRIAREAKVPAEIYHLKAAGQSNWWKMDSVIRMVQAARDSGLAITADMYTYTVAGTGLAAVLPPASQDGGFGKLWQRLHDPAVRKKLAAEMDGNPTDWENFYYAAGSPENIRVLEFGRDSLKKYQGMTLGQVARLRGKSPEETAMDLLIDDSANVQCAYTLMTEDNIRKEIVLPWVSFGSDEGSFSPEGVFLKFLPHPRAYGNFVRVLGKYARDEKLMPLEEAIRKLSWLPASNLGIEKRGALVPGYFADVVIFDPKRVQDHATFDRPHQFATGVSDVIVNGVPVLERGQHTGAFPGRVVRGAGAGGL